MANAEPVPRSAFVLHLLGGCQFIRRDRVVRLETVKTSALLAYLAAQPLPQSRLKLTGLLWGGLPEAHARRNLRHALWNLRRQFNCPGAPPLLLIDPLTVAFNRQADYWLDVEELEQRLSASERVSPTADLQQAVELYRGDLLDGLYVEDAPEFDEWLLAERERLRALIRRALEQLVRLAIASGAYEPGLEHARRLLALDPWVEEGHRQMMRLLALSGRRGAALAQYETCCRILKEQVGVQPSEETTALYRELVEIPVAAREVRLTNLPIPLARFIGREREIEEIRQLVGPRRVVGQARPGALVTLTGAGGCGKTRLAIQIADQVVDSFEDGVWWVDLAAVVDPSLVPHVVAETMGIRGVPNEPLDDTLVKQLCSKQLLLVLDNCEHLIDACARLAALLLGACPNLTILATSREAFDIDGEITWRVPSLSFPKSEDWPIQPNAYESIRLFVDRAATGNAEFALTGENARFVAQVCRRLDGIPLAIELAAARVKVLTVEQIAAGLDDRFHLLTRGTRTALPRHRTLRAMIDWSYDLLNDLERRLFRALSVFAGGWTLEAAQQVATTGTVLDLLARLVDKCLVVAEDQGGEFRYRYQETMRQYAHDRLVECGGVEPLQRRHLDYFLELAEAGKTPETAWLDRLEMEHDNFRAALGFALAAHKGQAGLRLAAALGEFWERRGYLTEGSEWFRRTIAGGGDASAGLRAKALVRSARLEWTHGSYECAVQLAEQSLQLYRVLGDKAGMALALQILGGVMHYQGGQARAAALLDESLALHRETASQKGIAETLLWLACTRTRQGDRERSRALWEECLTCFRDMDEEWGIGVALGGLGDVARLDGDYTRARALLEDSLIVHWQQRNKSSITFALEALATLASVQGLCERAVQLWGAADTLREAIGTRVPPVYAAEYAPHQARVRREMGEDAFAIGWSQGHARTVEEAVEYALADSGAAATTCQSEPSYVETSGSADSP